MVDPLIAVVDNDDAFLDLMDDVLTEDGYRVVVERASERVIAMLAHEQPSLLILDLRMGEHGSGMALLRLLRGAEETASLPILIGSADQRFLGTHASEIHTCGAEILYKPFDLSELYARVAQLVASESYTEPPLTS